VKILFLYEAYVRRHKIAKIKTSERAEILQTVKMSTHKNVHIYSTSQNVGLYRLQITATAAPEVTTVFFMNRFQMRNRTWLGLISCMKRILMVREPVF